MTKLESRIIAILGIQGRNLNAKELRKALGLNKSQRAEYEATLAHLLRQDIIFEKMGGRYALRRKDTGRGKPGGEGLVSAEIVKITATFGFARPQKEGAADVFIPGRRLLGAMPGDIVQLRIRNGSRDLPEGEVDSISVAADKPFSVVVSKDADGKFVLPDRYANFPIRLDPSDNSAAVHGDKALAVLSYRGERHFCHLAKIVEVYGDASKAKACCGSILASNGITIPFPEEVREQAEVIASFTGIHPKELASRRDLRGERIFTIDGADAKDLDDAVSLRRLEEGWELGVHIADVSYYVTHKSPLDLEALNRGTSVYYADSVVPMLPTELSNGICSLNPGEDRLTFSSFVRLDREGKIVSYSFEKTVIRSAVKGVYHEVNALLDGASMDKYAGLEDTLRDMKELAALLEKNRYARGGMDLETLETKIIVDDNGTAIALEARERGISERIIEEFMLTANEAAADYALKLSLPFVFRVHEPPSPDKLDVLYQMLDSLGIKHQRKGQAVTPGALSGILNEAKGTDLAPVVNTFILRSMAKAKYSSVNAGHFGLALKHYAHFTSPIRRYPDLIIHRFLSGHVTGMKMENLHSRFDDFAYEAAARSTEREIAAMTAERDCEACYKAEFMGRYVGEEFNGTVSSVTSVGAYIQLENTADGLIRLAEFPPGEWIFDNIISFSNARGKGRIRVGDKVRVKITEVNVSAGQISMAFAEDL